MDPMFYDEAGMVDFTHVHAAFALAHDDDERGETIYAIAILMVIGQQIDRFLLEYATQEARDAALQRCIAQHQRWRHRHGRTGPVLSEEAN